MGWLSRKISAIKRLFWPESHKRLYAYQQEINRLAEEIRKHQITLGDDKLVMRVKPDPNKKYKPPGIYKF